MSIKAILLIHGFHRTAKDLGSMADFFQSKGYTVLVPELPTTKGRLGECATTLHRFWIKEPRNYSEVHLVGHSYGGLILREYLARYKITNLASLTCFGSTHQGSRIADYLTFFGKHFREPALLEFRTPGPLINPPRQGWPPLVHLIAGNHNDLWFGRIFLKNPADGRLTVDSALAQTPGGLDCRFPEWTRRTILPLNHHEQMHHPILFLSVLEGIEQLAI